MGRKYHRVYPATLWGHDRRHWADDTRLAAAYFMTCTHRTTEGLFFLSPGYAAVDLGWTVERLEGALSALQADSFLAYDETLGVMLLLDALEWQPPDNENQVKGAVRQMIASGVHESVLLEQLYQRAKLFSQRFAEGLLERFPERLRDGSVEPLAEPDPEPIPKPSPEPIPQGIPDPIPDPPSPSPSLSPSTPQTIVGPAAAEPDVEQPQEDMPRRKPNMGALKALAVLSLVKEQLDIPPWRVPHKFLIAWLQDKDITVEDAVLLVEFKIFDWKGGEFERFSRNQKTLFGPDKREDYLHDAKLWDSKRTKKEPDGPPICGVKRDDFSIEFGANTCIADPDHEGDHWWSQAHRIGEPPPKPYDKSKEVPA